MRNANYRAGKQFHSPKYWRPRLSAFEMVLMALFVVFVAYLLFF